MSAGAPSRYDYEFDPDDNTSTAARICKLVGQGRDVLELGCAAGAMTAVLARHYGCRVTGVEMDAEAAEAAALHAEAVHIASLEAPGWAAPLNGRQFDTVLAADVLEHLHDPAACLQQLHALLAADGSLVVSVPNIAHGGVIASLLCGEFDYRDVGLLDRTHVYFFTPASLRRMLRDNGFVVEHETIAPAGAWHPEFSQYWKALPGQLQAWLERGPVAAAYQSIMVARRTDAQAASETASAAEAVDAGSAAVWVLESSLAAWLAEASALLEPAPEPEAGEGAAGGGNASFLAESAAVAELQQRVQELEGELQSVYSSHSWRLTGALRAVARLLRGRQG